MEVTIPHLTASAATAEVAEFVSGLRWEALTPGIRNAALRQSIDTIAALVAGARNEIVEAVGGLMGADARSVPGFAANLRPETNAYLAGIAAHAFEVDDGYRGGSVHPGCVVISAALAACRVKPVSGVRFLEGVVAGYETVIAIAGACHPAMRERGFHPTGAVGPFGAAAVVTKLLGLPPAQIRSALGLAASGSSGLFAFLNDGADVKRLHAGHAAREGLLAALLAERGVAGPQRVLECRDGFAQAFAGSPERADRIALPPAAEFGITQCYIKPYPCCRHLQPALQALIEIVGEHDLLPQEVRSIEVETYSIAAAHGGTGWADLGSAQLSFPYVLAVGLHERGVRLEHFSQQARASDRTREVRQKLTIRATAEMDALYPRQRPARVTLVTGRGTFGKFMGEAAGSPEFPLSEAEVDLKFDGLVAPVLGQEAAHRLRRDLRGLESVQDVASVTGWIGRKGAMLASLEEVG